MQVFHTLKQLAFYLVSSNSTVDSLPKNHPSYYQQSIICWPMVKVVYIPKDVLLVDSSLPRLRSCWAYWRASEVNIFDRIILNFISIFVSWFRNWLMQCMSNDSILMAPKLKEMDDIIKEIHMQSIVPQKNSNSQTLLVCDLNFFITFHLWIRFWGVCFIKHSHIRLKVKCQIIQICLGNISWKGKCQYASKTNKILLFGNVNSPNLPKTDLTITDQINIILFFLQVVVSDHGMTEAGNHGGSSYEETDSLALFIGHGIRTTTHGKNVNNEAFQVYVKIFLGNISFVIVF